MTTVLLRVWLPDRPGALGEVASAIGLAGGDVVGIEILERGGGRAIDELVVSLPEGVDVNALVARVSAVAGADIEDVRPVDDDEHDLGMAAVELAADLAEASDRAVVLARLTHAVHTTLAADWAVIVASGGVLSEVVGDAPSAPWLSAYLEGVRHVAGAGPGTAPTMWRGPSCRVRGSTWSSGGRVVRCVIANADSSGRSRGERRAME